MDGAGGGAQQGLATDGVVMGEKPFAADRARLYIQLSLTSATRAGEDARQLVVLQACGAVLQAAEMGRDGRR